uniref:Uncharacterized protein n=1 Tax=Romanomermis culicivorax TaxID=13658 RepID=A0A915L592_ROMCU
MPMATNISIAIKGLKRMTSTSMAMLGLLAISRKRNISDVWIFQSMKIVSFAMIQIFLENIFLGILWSNSQELISLPITGSLKICATI